MAAKRAILTTAIFISLSVLTIATCTLVRAMPSACSTSTTLCCMAGILMSKAKHIRHIMGMLSLGNMLDIIKVNPVGTGS